MCSQLPQAQGHVIRVMQQETASGRRYVKAFFKLHVTRHGCQCYWPHVPEYVIDQFRVRVRLLELLDVIDEADCSLTANWGHQDAGSCGPIPHGLVTQLLP